MPDSQVKSQDPIGELFDKAMSEMGSGELWYAFGKRLAQLKTPLPKEYFNRIFEALSAFESMPIEKKVEALNTMISTDRLGNRAAWPLPAGPHFRVPSPEIQDRAIEVMNGVARQLLLTGTLPQEHVSRLADSVLSGFPKSHDLAKKVVVFGGAAAVCAASITFSPLWVSVPTVIASIIASRALTKTQNIHEHYAKGFMYENLDALGQVFMGQPVPIVTSISTHFLDTENSESRCNRFEMDGFLVSRTLRILGFEPKAIAEIFQDPKSVDMPGNPLVPTVEQALKAHGIELDSPLIMVLEGIKEEKNQQTLKFLELMNAAHFVWAARDRENLRGEFAEIILATAGRGEPVVG